MQEMTNSPALSTQNDYNLCHAESADAHRQKDRVLFVTTIEFRSPFNGGTVYSKGIYEALCANHEVDVVVLSNERFFKNDKIHKIVTFLKGVISSTPVNVIYHSGCSRVLQQDLSIYRHVFVDHLEAVLWVQKQKAKYILIAHNIEYKLANDKLRNPVLRQVFDLQKRLERYERNSFAQAAGVICISATEKDVIAQVNPRVSQLRPAFSETNIRYSHSEIPRFGFIGPASWLPNYRTVQSLIKDVFTRVRPPFQFVLAGSGWEAASLDFPAQTKHLGFVKDINEFWSNIDLLVAPIQQGAGVNIKICEALHHGVNVVSNSESIAAIFGNAPAPSNLWVADNPTEIAEVLNDIDMPFVRNPCDDFSQAALRLQLNQFLDDLDG
ncbi:glycosyltransferase [Halomonas beimenensis]|uniref:Glycosyltransferase involved in cell wall bisynthesis n=1 Tax=Halomonas beimenensis TaxID=475662 RepID=A0A291P6Y2_9GAMM|nr:glycosyltransferase [Halomonas beimenensis]ATJ82673.1 glycosyltransferase involved in cell wall bisynthesis [Halomonas beimenensis]